MISEAARTRPTTTPSHNEAPTGADNTSAMMMPLHDLDRLKGPARSSPVLTALYGRRFAGDYG